MHKKKIYLAGAMECHGNSVYPTYWRNEAKKILFEFDCISPLDFYNYGETDYYKSSEVMRFDLWQLKECDIVLVDLNRIRESLGTSDEILYAYLLGKPIIGFVNKVFPTVKDLESYVHSWKYEQVSRIETGTDAFQKACEYINYYYSD